MNDATDTPAAADPDTLTLSKPATLGTETYPTLTFLETNAGAWEPVDRLSGLAAEAYALSVVTRTPLPAIESLGVRDFRAAMAKMGSVITPEPISDEDANASTFTLPLRVPVTLGEETVTELALREPTAKEWREWEALSGTAADIKAIATITGVREVVVRMIDIRDVQRAAAWIGRFFVDAPATGA